MGKLKNKIMDKFKSIFKCFPLTLIIGFIFTIFLAITIDNEAIDVDLIPNVSIFSILFAIGTFTIESIMKKNVNKKKILFYILSVLIAGIVTLFVNIEKDILGIENRVFVDYVFRFALTYGISLMLFSLFALYKMSGLKFNEYVTKVSVNMFKSGIIYSLLTSGIAMILGVFCMLLLNDDSYDIIFRAEILLFGFFFVSRLMFSLVDIEGSVNKFFEGIFKYVLDVLLIIAFVVIYLYIGKIIILRDMPVNQLYRIVAALFVLGVPIWTITSYFEDKKIISNINRYLPIAFVPFILLQVYTLGVRIIGNGLTELRYMAVMLIIFEIIYIAIYIKNREKVGLCALALMLITIISVIFPGVNMFKISELSQYKILKTYEIGKNLTSEEKAKIRGAYNYLIGATNGKKYIDKALTEEEKVELEKLSNYDYTDDYEGRNIITFRKNMDYVNISGYNKMYKIDVYNYEEVQLDRAFRNIECNNSNKKMDLSNIFVSAFSSDSPQTELENGDIMQIDENSAVVLEYVYIIYSPENNRITQYSIEGYLLEK